MERSRPCSASAARELLLEGLWLLGWLILIYVEEENPRPRQSRCVTSVGRAEDALGSLGAILRLSLKEPLKREKEVFATWERAVAI